jgi:hypothetical protein
MSNTDKDRIKEIIREIEADYQETGGDFFLFLLNYFFPKIDTESDYVTDEKGRYLSRCYFIPTEKKSAREKLDFLAKHLDFKYAPDSFWAHINIKSSIIPDSCKDEEFGFHRTWYGEDSDYFYIPVKTNIALQDKDVLTKIKEEKIDQYEFITKIMELFN